MKRFCEYTFTLLCMSAMSLISVTCIPSQGQQQQTKTLQGNVSRNNNTRIQRSSPGIQTRSATSDSQPQRSTLSSFLERSDFQLPKSDGSSTPQSTPLLPAIDKTQPLTGILQDHSNTPTFSSKPNPPPPSNVGSNSSTRAPHAEQKTNKQIILIRLTYYMLDEQNPFYAFRFAEQLQKKHQDNIDVVVLLEKEGTRCANKEQNTHMIVRNEKTAHKLSELISAFIQSGGKVVASREWAKAFGVTEGNLIQGVQLCDNDEVGDLIVNATKILEY